MIRTDFEDALTTGMVRYIGEATVERYLAAVSTVSVQPKEVFRDVSIVYTPLNGTGISCVPRSLAEHGFTHITIPEEQRELDGNFPTFPYPNPEVREALEVGLRWAEKTGSELLLATDPDCDRVCAAVRDKDRYTLISGNEMGALLLNFICKMRTANGTMPQRPVAVKTIVTTTMAAKVAAHYGVELTDVLTGFKFIGEQIGLLEVLDELYRAYGYYESRLLSFAFEGSSGFEKMRTLMDGRWERSPEEIEGYSVEKIVDYRNHPTGLLKSNVLRFFLSGGHESVVRPSGTEPKLKVYLTSIGKSREDSRRIMDMMEGYFRAWACK